MGRPLDGGQIEERMATAITALDASDYDQGTVAAAWTEAERYLLEDPDDPTAVTHLVFHALVDDGPVEDSTRDAPHGYCRVRSRAAVIFLYQLRPDSQKTDARLAMRAATDVVRAINALDGGEINVEIINVGIPTLSEDQSKLAMRVLFDILHEIEV